MRIPRFYLLLLACAPVPALASAASIPASFESWGGDRRAIEALLGAYTKAVSTKDRALFETLLLNKSIPFSPASLAIRARGAVQGAQNYQAFAKGVFAGPPFQQRFQDVHILQDGPLAQVSLVFVNTSTTGTSWGWKTMQLLKLDGRWKIASEFYTGHA